MQPYITIVQKMYPKLIYFKCSALKPKPGTPSQYEGYDKRLHSDYKDNVNLKPPGERPVSILLALDEFEFMYLPHNNNPERREIETITIKPQQMIAFTNRCFHAGGSNMTNKTCYRLFAYLVSHESEYPGGEVFHGRWKQHSNSRQGGTIIGNNDTVAHIRKTTRGRITMDPDRFQP